ncbi:General stress protein Gls24 family [Lactococcus lactis subsp. lactis]|uniref:Stress response regulator gls24 homolog n=1 Tax=Lactococcus lactis subsp. lactis TaxID=1360 RepID=A0A0V8CL16_LACLL|nr:Asp23/Gls24 family envelope stress response protein [Lactococcus lactis]KSU02018.1 General stress protein Gls24 family [Lactococcus lactis subsp. lactis]
MVQENTKTEVTEVKGSLTYEDKVIQKIVGLALESVNGLLSVDGGFFSNLTGKLVNTDDVTAGVGVEVGKKQVAVDLKVVTEYKKNVPDIYQKIKDVIRKEVSDMTDLEVVEVNVTVVDIKTKEQQKDDEKSLQDRVVGAAQTTGKFTSDQVDQVDKVKEKVDDMGDDARVK